MARNPTMLELTDGEGFGCVPRIAFNLLAQGKIGFTDFAVFARLCERMGGSAHSDRTIQIGASKLGRLCGGVSRWAIYKVLEKLEIEGLVRCVADNNGHAPIWQIHRSSVQVEVSKSLPSKKRERPKRPVANLPRDTCGKFTTPTCGDSATAPVANPPTHSKKDTYIPRVRSKESGKNAPPEMTKSDQNGNAENQNHLDDKEGSGLNGSVRKEKSKSIGPRSKELFKMMKGNP